MTRTAGRESGSDQSAGALQEIRLELDDSKLKGIITELDILHRATGPEIVEFYGAFFIESCVYYWCVWGLWTPSAPRE